MKKLLSLLSLVILPFIANAQTKVEIDGIYYNVVPKGKLAEVVSGKKKYTGEVIIPESVTYDGVEYDVKTIGEGAFYDCTGLTSVTIPNSVTEIGGSAFTGCTGLTSVNISDLAAWCNIRFENKGSNPLCYAHKLYLNGKEIVNLVIPNSVTEIGGYAFSGCTGLTSVTIPNSVTEIGGSAFSGCTGLTSVTIPNSVTKISDYAFSGCTGLTSVTIPNSVTAIGNSAFYGCTGLTSVTIPNSVTAIGNSAFSGCTGLTSVTIPNSVTAIGNSAFSGCTGLTSVTIPNSVTAIGGSAFYSCTGLTSVNISDLAAWCSIRFEYFSNPLSYAHKLYLNGKEIVNLVIPNSVTEIGGYAFSGCTGLTSVTIPNSVTKISDYAFSGCTGLTSVTIPNSVTKISDSAFSGCTGLTSVTIPNSVTAIGFRAFSGCTGLTSVTIPNSVTEIGRYAFDGCTGLTSVTIPNSVKTIGGHAFANCSNLETVYCYAENVPKVDSSSFSESYIFYESYIKYATLYVPDGSLEEYKNHSEWGKFGTILPLSGGSGGSEVEKEKCEAPTISQKNGKINISCGTENAVIEYNYSIAANGGGTFGKDPLNPVARITVNAWASAEGYDTSDITTATFDVACAGSGNKGDVNEDGTVDISDVVKVINIMAGGE